MILFMAKTAASKQLPANGQTYAIVTESLAKFYQEQYEGGYSDIARASSLSAKAVANALKGNAVAQKTAKAIWKHMKTKGFSGEYMKAFRLTET
jgi:hypothetical protein